MFVKMLSLAAGPTGTRHPGEIHEVGQAEGEQLVAGGYAERVAAPVPELETAEAPNETEKAVPPAARRRGKGQD